jgi:hypothetical protein
MTGARLGLWIAESLDAAIRGLGRIWLGTCKGSLLSEAQQNFGLVEKVKPVLQPTLHSSVA